MKEDVEKSGGVFFQLHQIGHKRVFRARICTESMEEEFLGLNVLLWVYIC